MGQFQEGIIGSKPALESAEVYKGNEGLLWLEPIL